MKALVRAWSQKATELNGGTQVVLEEGALAAAQQQGDEEEAEGGGKTDEGAGEVAGGTGGSKDA